MRKPPPELTLPPLERQEPKRIVLLRAYRLLTPLFGGGVRAGEVDTTTPIRATAVRGQLRFWWRATRGGEFADVAAMKQREDAVWGSTRQASPVVVTVLKANPGQVYTKARNSRGEAIPIGEPASDHSYVAFPLKGQRPSRDRPGKEPGEVHEGVTFTLRIDFPPSCRFDVQAALWAWETFGGIGARTRRGFGALECVSVKLDPESAPENEADWRWVYPYQNAAARLADDIAHFVSKGDFPVGVPHLSRDARRLRAVPVPGGALAAWQRLFRALKEFRQDRRPPAGGGGRPGRSYWPEPDAIRHLALRGPLHPYRQPIYRPRLDKFPRAAFGLPIVFQFKSETGGPMEPGQTQLQGRDYDRLASPLILRSLACEGGAVGLAVVLDGPRPWDMPGGLMLKDAPGNPPADARLDATTAATVAGHTQRYRGNPDVLQDFLDSL